MIMFHHFFTMTTIGILFLTSFKYTISAHLLLLRRLSNNTISNKKLPLALLNNKEDTHSSTAIESKEIQHLDGAILQDKLRKKVEENSLRKERNYDKINETSVSPSILLACKIIKLELILIKNQ